MAKGTVWRYGERGAVRVVVDLLEGVRPTQRAPATDLRTIKLPQGGSGTAAPQAANQQKQSK